MIIQVMTIFVVPVFQAMWRENAFKQPPKTSLNHKQNKHEKFIKIDIRVFYYCCTVCIAIPKPDSPKDSLYLILELAAKTILPYFRSFSEYKAALQKVPQVGGLPDPELTSAYLLNLWSWWKQRMADIRLMQMFPWFGTLKSAKDEMSLMAKAKFESFRDAKLQVFYDVKRTWYELQKVQQDIQISEKNLDILRTIERLTLVKFKTAPTGG